ncbi:MAG TPA: 5-formyltetrahydrofolate cyclo-ligase [Dysgonamonadaceae bacterium]|nr:5-formyltetrahydrofolate cyclo-ligase [Dysgonamonadaceae bacterium]
MKHKLRKEISKTRAIYSEEQLKQFSEDIFKILEQTQVFSDAKYILAYYSFPGEVFTHDFIEKHTKNKIIVLPVVKNDVLVLKEFNGVGKMEKSAFGILEPVGKEFTDYSKIDLAIVPGMSFDRSLNRLGRGKAYYDSLLPKLAAYLIGICFSFQLRENIPFESHDFPMNCVITQDEIIY